MIPLTIDARSLLVPLALCSGVAHATPLGEPMDEALLFKSQATVSTDRRVVQGLVPPPFPSLAVVRLSAVAVMRGRLKVFFGEHGSASRCDGVEVVPSEGRLDLDLYVTLSSTGRSHRFGCCSILTDLDETFAGVADDGGFLFIGLFIMNMMGLFRSRKTKLNSIFRPLETRWIPVRCQCGGYVVGAR